MLDKKRENESKTGNCEPDVVSQDRISLKAKQFLQGMASDEDSSDKDFLQDSDSESEVSGDAKEEDVSNEDVCTAMLSKKKRAPLKSKVQAMPARRITKRTRLTGKTKLAKKIKKHI